MLINKLYVEGALDSKLLGPILAGKPLVVVGDGKDNSHRKTLRERANGQITLYLRDRDFDAEPTERDEVVPIHDHGQIIGWHWSRHEIENYLLEPSVFSRTFSSRQVCEEEFTTALLESAVSIRFYQMARWAVGRVRRHRGLPNPRTIHTQHFDCKGKDYRLPNELGYAACETWALASTETFLKEVMGKVSISAITQELTKNADEFTLDRCSEVQWVLHTFAGKDLFAGMEGWLQSRLKLSPSQACNQVKDWIIENQKDALELLPEWKRFFEGLRSPL